MSPTYAPRTYAPSSYDDHFCLKPPALLWIATLYLSRAVVLLIAYDVAPLVRLSSDFRDLLRGSVSVGLLVSSFIAAPVLYTLCRRAPTSTKPVRWIWAHGKLILALAAVVDCAASTLGSGIFQGDAANLLAGSLVAALFDVYFLVYILTTPRVRDAFADFPPPAASLRGNA
jgi:hypothetical protein